MRTRIWHSDWKPRWLIRCVSAALLSFMDKQERLCVVRSFAVWLQGLDNRHEVPPKGLLPGRGTHPRQRIYSEAEIERIVVTAAALPSPSGLRGSTCSTLFGLIAVTGLRIGEALGASGW